MPRSFAARLYRYTWRYKMTPGGKLLTAMIGLASVGTISIEVPIYLLCCALLGLVFAAELTGAVMRPRLSVQPRWPARLTAGESATVPVRLTNTSWRPALDVMLTLLERPKRLRHTNADAVVSRLARRQSLEMPLTLRPLARGRMKLPAVDAHSTFPFNLVRIPGGQSDGTSLLVRPAFTPLASLALPIDPGAQVGELAPSGQVGESIEYLGNREYTPGEPIRRLDMRAWARTGHPVVREYQTEQGSRLGLLVDTRLPARRPRAAEARMEAGISLAAACADSILTRGYDVPLLATGTDLYVLDRLAPDRLDHLLDLLGEIRPTQHDSYPRMQADVVEQVSDLAGVLVVLCDWDASRATLLRQLEAAGVPLRVFGIADARGPFAAANLAGLQPASPVPIEPVPAAEITAGSLETL